MSANWASVADGVWVRRHEELDLSIGLVVGDAACLVIDTRGDAKQGTELASAVREITSRPWSLVYTHAHWDHAYGASAFGDVEIWAHRSCRAYLEALDRPEIVLPNQLFDTTAELTIGGRRVNLFHPGPAHTDHDVIVHVPDANVLFAGDLVEDGAPPQFGDAFPLTWPDAMDQILAVGADVVVPGHGDPTDNEFVAKQRDELVAIADLCRSVWAGELSDAEAITQSPYPEDFTRAALARETSRG
jgi:glyoxylase-like metal-dependent hydrolase (beta-lactamase superfamily II)